jgi:ubiquinone/menaquinone biosynthesis C-methylase UbiE
MAKNLNLEKMRAYYDRKAHLYDCAHDMNEVAICRGLAAQISDQWAPGARLLDLCAGTGLVGQAVQSTAPGIGVTAMDISPVMLNLARQKLPQAGCVVANADARFPFPDKTFDMVAMISMLSHLERPMRVFNEVSRVLKPQGWLLMDVSPIRKHPGDEDEPASSGIDAEQTLRVLELGKFHIVHSQVRATFAPKPDLFVLAQYRI